MAIVTEQWDVANQSGLTEAANEIVVGINGGSESDVIGASILPPKAKRVLHGLQSKAENLTIVELEKWLPSHPGWDVLYFHAKGCTHKEGDPYNGFNDRWRQGMNEVVLAQWRRCRMDLANGYESVGCHFMRGLLDGTQNIWAGNFWWAKSDFLRTLPSIYARDRIKVSGIAAAESRYESEVWIGNGPRCPNVREYPTAGVP